MYRSLYISLLTLTLFCGVAKAQLSASTTAASNAVSSMQSNAKANKEDEEESKKKKKQYIIIKDQGLSLGVDLSPVITHFVKDERTGIAFIGRYGIKNRLFAGAELGYENIKYNTDTYKYTSNGTFIRLGVDYDIFNNEDYPSNDNIFIGARYAYAWQTQACDKFTIVDSYWGDYQGSVSNSAVNSHSIDLLAGLRCEVLKNFYMGWSFRARFLIYSQHSDELKPYIIAGYGKYDSRVNMGFTYTLEYQIPFNKLRSRK